MIAGTKIKLALLGIFALGVAVGALADNLYRVSVQDRRTQQNSGRPKPIDMLTQRLNLRPDQVIQVDRILSEAGEEYEKLRGQLRPQFDEVRNRQRDKVRALLDAQQKEAYAALLEEMAQHRRPPR